MTTFFPSSSFVFSKDYSLCFFSFTDNAGLCGIPGLATCGPHLSAGAKVGIVVSAFLCLLFLAGFSVVWWKRRLNILRAQRIAGKNPPNYCFMAVIIVLKINYFSCPTYLLANQNGLVG